MLGYTDYNEDATVPISITCKNWRNPTVQKEIPDFYLRTYDLHKDEIIDSSDSITVDASEFSAKEIELIEYILSTPYAGQISRYLFHFHVDVPVSNTGKCYLKLQFPQEIKLGENIEIKSTGMLVDAQGKQQSTVVDKNLEEGWILIEGCNFDPTLAESSDFELDVFKVTIDNVKNPDTEADTSPFSFEVFKSYN